MTAKGKSLACRQREMLALELYEGGTTTADIAARFGVQRPSVNRMIHEARKARAAHAATKGETNGRDTGTDLDR
jgi:DNA-binding transcriptional regulator LsrR (DeoR family)